MKKSRALLLGILITTVLFITVYQLFLARQIGVLEYNQTVFSPASGENFPIPISLKNVKALTLKIYSDDNDLIREFKLDESPSEIVWDGKDEEGLIVPDEAYYPVLDVLYKNGRRFIQDYRSKSGGELVQVTQLKQQDGLISYELEVPARVLIRLGDAKGGALLRNILSWKAQDKGVHRIAWDGFDIDKVQYIDDDQASVYVQAFELGKHAIITHGNSEYDYRAYRSKKGWVFENVDPKSIQLERNGKQLSKESFFPVYRNLPPRISAQVTPLMESDKRGIFNVLVDIEKDDRWLMEASQYEIGFFVNREFITEVEQGYVPMTWVLDPKKLDLETGENVLTVNVTSFGGQIGVKHVKFFITNQ